ncbi:Hypothetical protein, putative [Bodo saltans]|uniref:Uncharacterized protein n=1 Tax=Bodo saltans TaxID=75058 RepID=A0A0S4JGX4_BODSA|nr:Hypothetical protein, putative [Bodo saltans]|eukprot:CUG90706.1 Hypothetical protein, putative [Bodo saltans]
MSVPLTSSLGIRVSKPRNSCASLITGVRTVGYDGLQEMLQAHSLSRLRTSPDEARSMLSTGGQFNELIGNSHSNSNNVAGGDISQYFSQANASGSVLTSKTAAFAMGYTTGGVFGQFREMAGGSAHVLIETVDARPASFIIADTPKSQAASLLRLTQARLVTSAETITSSAEVEPPGPQQVSPQHPLEGGVPETFLFAGERLTNADAPHAAQPSGLDWRELDDDVIQSKFIMTIATAGDTGAAEAVEPPMASSHSYTSSSNTDQRTVGKRRARHGLMRNPLVGQSAEIDRLSAGNKAADASQSVSSREIVTSYETACSGRC